MEFWIDHCAVSCPVSFKRWAIFKLSVFAYGWSARFNWWWRRLEHAALYPDEEWPDDLPFSLWENR